MTLRSLLEMRSGIAFDGEGGKLGDASSADKNDDTAPYPFGSPWNPARRYRALSPT